MMQEFSALSDVFDRLRHNYDDTYWWRRVLTRRNARLQGLAPGEREGIDVMAEDWDNLLLLDACRTDLFEEAVDTSTFDSYQRTTSLGSLTPEWIEQNFRGRRFDDTVYVTANPWVSRLARDSFYRLIEPWRDAFDDAVWTVPAEAVVDAATEHFESDKRLVAHFMQPHPPFIRASNGGVERILGLDSAHWRPERIEADGEQEVYNVWHALGRGALDRSEVWDAYRASLEYVFERAQSLARDLSGKTVITSDHGILLGERLSPIPIRAYGHPRGVRHRRLTEVPWAVIEGSRRQITDAPRARSERADLETEEVTERLRMFGYAE